MPELISARSDGRETVAFAAVGVVFLILIPLLNVLPAEESWWHVSDFRLNQFGKFLAFAILALGLDLIWGYCGVLESGAGRLFRVRRLLHGDVSVAADRDGKCLRQRAPGLHGLDAGQRAAPVLVSVQELCGGLPRGDAGADAGGDDLGFLAFRSRIKGVYFAIITQALAFAAWLVFNRNETRLGGTNGLTDFKQVLGFRLSDPSTQRGLYILTVLALAAAYLLCRWIVASRAGNVLIAIRDSESRVTFSGYTPWMYKLFVFVVAAGLAGVAGMLYVPQVGIITPAQIGVLPSLEVVIWVAVGGRGTLVGAILGAVAVNYGRSVLTNYFPEAWPFILGGLFVVVVTLFPDGLVGMLRKLRTNKPSPLPVMKTEGTPVT